MLEGSKNSNWRGGRVVAPNGYVLVRVGVDHHLADVRGYAYEHRLVAEQKLGRRLLPGEEVHHANNIRSDNDPANLEVKANRLEHAQHRRKRADLQKPTEPNVQVSCACGCGGTFLRYDATRRPRRFLPSHNVKGRPSHG